MKVNLKIVAGAAATLLFAGNASAAVLTAVSKDYSKEGFTVTTGAELMPTIQAVLAADYKADDRIALTIGGGAALDASTDLSASMTCNNGITVGFLSRSGTTVNFRVTQILEVNNLGATCQISGISLTRASLAGATTVTASYAARTIQGEVIDTGCATPNSPSIGAAALFACGSTNPATVPNLVTIASVQAQFNATVTKNGDVFDGVIDVEADRRQFEDGNFDSL
jgi:hypothetical protein